MAPSVCPTPKEACTPVQQLPLGVGGVDVVEYERRWIEALNRGEVSAANNVFAPGCVIHIIGSPVPDLDVAGFKQILAGFLAASPDVCFTIADQIDAGDRGRLRWTAEGTNTGPLGAVPPTGRRVRIDGLLFDRVAGGRVLERWEQRDHSVTRRQLELAEHGAPRPRVKAAARRPTPGGCGASLGRRHPVLP